jgi:hypothetical protein
MNSHRYIFLYYLDLTLHLRLDNLEYDCVSRLDITIAIARLIQV